MRSREQRWERGFPLPAKVEDAENRGTFAPQEGLSTRGESMPIRRHPSLLSGTSKSVCETASKGVMLVHYDGFLSLLATLLPYLLQVVAMLFLLPILPTFFAAVLDCFFYGEARKIASLLRRRDVRPLPKRHSAMNERWITK